MRLLLISACLLASVCGQNNPFQEPEKIVRASNTVGERLGNYAIMYETEGGIVQSETGQRKYANTDGEVQLIQGSVQYNAPDGTPVAFSWTADEFGTQIVGSHIPTPPPIPKEIQRALDWLAKQPSTTEDPSYTSERSVNAPIAKPVNFNKPPPVLKKQQFYKPQPFKKQQF